MSERLSVVTQSKLRNQYEIAGYVGTFMLLDGLAEDLGDRLEYVQTVSVEAVCNYPWWLAKCSILQSIRTSTYHDMHAELDGKDNAKAILSNLGLTTYRGMLAADYLWPRNPRSKATLEKMDFNRHDEAIKRTTEFLLPRLLVNIAPDLHNLDDLCKRSQLEYAYWVEDFELERSASSAEFPTYWDHEISGGHVLAASHMARR